jgi:hypothetical protein
MKRDAALSTLTSGAERVPAAGPFGRVFTPKELAAMWQLSENSIRRLFQDEQGVFVMGDSNPRGKRGYSTIRIPEAVALRVWRERTRCTV